MTTKTLPLLATACLLLAAFAHGQTAAPSPTPDQRTLKVLGASYHAGQDAADVTETVTSLLRREVSFTAKPAWLRVDPRPRQHKTLDIFCEVDGKLSFVSLDENADVSRDILLNQAHPVQATTESTIDPPDPGQAYRVSPFAADPVAFPTVTFPVNDEGAPTIQTIRINSQPDGISHGTAGFRFRVNRTEAAARQHVADKTKMHLFWFFVAPPGTHWFIEPVQGRMRGFTNFFPLKPSAFKNIGDLRPNPGHDVIIQKLGADRFEEGREYIVYFDWSQRKNVPAEMSIAVGYRLDDRNFIEWQDLTDIARFLGLEPAGNKVGVAQRSY